MGPFYRDEFAMGDSVAGPSNKFKATSPPMNMGPDPANIIPAFEDNQNAPARVQAAQHENQILAAHCKNENEQKCSQASCIKIEKTDSRQPINLTSRFSKVNFCISLQADNDPAGKDFTEYRDLTVTVVQASRRHPLHGYDLKFTRAQVLYNGNGDLLVIYTPYLQDGIYQVVSDGALTTHPDLPDTFTRQCCLLKRPDTDKMADGSQYIILGELKDVPTNLTETGDLVTDIFVKFSKGKDFLQVVFPILLGCGHKDVWSSQLEVSEAIQPICLNGNRTAFDSWLELHRLRSTPSYEDCFSDRDLFREYMNQRFNTWDHVTTECEYYKQMHTALCQGCRDCMSREAYVDSLKQRKLTTKAAYNNATLSLLKAGGNSPKTPGRPRKKRKAGRKCWTKRSRVSEERSIMAKAMTSILPFYLDTITNKTPRVPEKIKYGFYKHSHPAGEDSSANYNTATYSDASSSSVISTDTATKKPKELSETSEHNVETPKTKSSRKRRVRVDKAVTHKNTSQDLQDISVTRNLVETQDKSPKLSGKAESGSTSSSRKSSLGKRRHMTEELPTTSEAFTTDNLTNVKKKDAANELSQKSENTVSLKRKSATNKRQRMVTEGTISPQSPVIQTPVTSGLEATIESITDKTIADNINNNMETETPADNSLGPSKRNRKRKAVCTCVGCTQPLILPKKIVRFDKDITKDDTVKQSASEARAN